MRRLASHHFASGFPFVLTHTKSILTDLAKCMGEILVLCSG